VAELDLGWALVLAGNSDQAREPLQQAFTLAVRTEQWVVAGDARALQAEVSIAAGDLERAETLIHDALEFATTHGFADLPQVGHYHLMAGTIHARRGNHEEADRLINLALQQMRDSWEPLIVAQALISLASVRNARGARAEARAILDEARSLIDACPDPGILMDRLIQATHALVPAYRRADQDTKLTEREMEVLDLLAAGATERDAAQRLFVSYSTIHSHTKSIYHKLGCSSRDEAVARARMLGLLA
jgi:LuxR family maltose regulon positive regulatory protein